MRQDAGLESPYLLDVGEFVGRGIFRSLYGPAITYLAGYLIRKELVVKLLTVLITVLMWWSTNVLAGETHFLLGVDGMSCPFCVYGIEKQLKKVDGVEGVRADLTKGNIWVEASGADVLSEDSARLLLEEAGFTLRSFEVHQSAQHEPEKDEHGKNESRQDE